MIAAAVAAWLAVGALVAWGERDSLLDDDMRWEKRMDGYAALFVIAVLWPVALALKALCWWRRR